MNQDIKLGSLVVVVCSLLLGRSKEIKKGLKTDSSALLGL